MLGPGLQDAAQPEDKPQKDDRPDARDGHVHDLLDAARAVDFGGLVLLLVDVRMAAM